MEDVGIFYGHLVYFTFDILHGHLVYVHILCSFGIFYGYMVYFLPFWYIVPIKIWQPWLRRSPNTKVRGIFFRFQY
jgi:hypothetical protein